jgi:hypothetical protein
VAALQPGGGPLPAGGDHGLEADRARHGRRRRLLLLPSPSVLLLPRGRRRALRVRPGAHHPSLLPLTDRRASWPDPAESEPGRKLGKAARTTARLLLRRRRRGPGPAAWGSRADQSAFSLRPSLSSRRPREI